MPDIEKYIGEFWTKLSPLLHNPVAITSLFLVLFLVVLIIIKIKLEKAKAFNKIKLKKGRIDFSHKSLDSHSLTLAASRSGKTVNILYPLLSQSFKENTAAFIYDYKFPDLTRYLYNLSLVEKKEGVENFFVNFSDPSRSHRVNPLSGLTATHEAVQLAKTIISNFDKGKDENTYWSKSAIGLLSSAIWFFTRYQGGRFSNLPTVIEFLTATADRQRLIEILSSDVECKILASNVISTMDSPETIASQISTVQGYLAAYANDQVYWVLGANSPGFTGFDLNNPTNPMRLICGNNPEAPDFCTPLISLLAEVSFMKMVKEGRSKSSFLLDEAGTFCIPSLPSRIATVGGYGINIDLACQDFAQLQHSYGRENAQAMRGSLSTKIYGKLSEGLQEISDSFGEVDEKNISYSYNSKGERSRNVSTTRVPAVRREFLSALQPGEFIIQDKTGKRFKQKFDYSPPKLLDLPVLTYVTKQMLKKNRSQIAGQVATMRV